MRKGSSVMRLLLKSFFNHLGASLSVVINYFYYLFYTILVKRVGSCNNCGKCCRHVYLRDGGKLVKSFEQCLALIEKDSRFNQFVAKGKNEFGELYFGCKNVALNNKCKVYRTRPMLCRSYPDVGMLRYGAIPKIDCGFSFVYRITGKKIV